MTFPRRRTLLLLGAAAALCSAAANPAVAQGRNTAGVKAAGIAVPPKKGPVHRVVIQVTQNDPVVMNMALNNAENLSSHYASRGETALIELVAYGPGLAMVRSDTSPVKDRLAALSEKKGAMTFSGCGNTMAAQGKAEGKEVTLVPQARIVPTGIARIVELQEQGWRYVRP